MKCVQETKLFQKTSLSYFTALRNNFMNNIEYCLIVEQIVHWSEYILNHGIFLRHTYQKQVTKTVLSN